MCTIFTLLCILWGPTANAIETNLADPLPFAFRQSALLVLCLWLAIAMAHLAFVPIVIMVGHFFHGKFTFPATRAMPATFTVNQQTFAATAMMWQQGEGTDKHCHTHQWGT
mmetsp:Transcript_97835/g.168675  ORF Transcript_97835/g.168675 Transcript_97835/m.168675 type:complete len:111 (-) Transcript_97835:152-484(-)